MIREQLGFALNRIGRREEAEQVLTAVIADYGAEQRDQRPARPRLQGPVGGGEEGGAGSRRARLPQACHRHLSRRLRGGLARPLSGGQCGDADGDGGQARAKRWARCSRSCATPPQQRVRKDGDSGGDYWDHATLLELAVLARDQDAAADHAASALAIVREPWEPATTARNLRLIREMRASARRGRGVDRRDRTGAGCRPKRALTAPAGPAEREGRRRAARRFAARRRSCRQSAAFAGKDLARGEGLCRDRRPPDRDSPSQDCWPSRWRGRPAAHPHVFVDARAEIVFDKAGADHRDPPYLAVRRGLHRLRHPGSRRQRRRQAQRRRSWRRWPRSTSIR